MAVIYTIPVWLVAFIIIGTLAMGVKLVATVMTILFFFFVLAIAYLFLFIWTWRSFIKPRTRAKQVLNGIESALAFLAWYFFLDTVYKDGTGLLTFFVPAVLFTIYIIAMFLMEAKDTTVRVALIASSVILCMWSIGYELSYDTKLNDDNIAYYKCVEVGEGKSRKAIYDEKLVYDDEESAIATCGVGDILTPSGEVERAPKTIWDSKQMIWYGVITDSGKKGYIKGDGIEVYYSADGQYVQRAQEELINKSWYKILPKPILKLCEKFFEMIPMGYGYNII